MGEVIISFYTVRRDTARGGSHLVVGRGGGGGGGVGGSNSADRILIHLGVKGVNP